MRLLHVIVLVAVVVVAGCGGATQSESPTAPTTSAPDEGTPTDAVDTPTPTPGTDSTTATATEPPASTAPPDPDEDVLGWEDGYWYNETIDVDPDDGLNDSELDAVVSRAMARVEEIRGLEFDERIPVEVISREQFREEAANSSTSPADRLHQNVKWEAMFMVNETTDAIAVQEANYGSSVLGYYSPSEGRIVVVSENTSSPKMNEITLAQELFHGLQDQRFNLSSYNQTTQELHNANDGIIEGDGNYVDYLYEQRCDGGWDCLMPEGGQSGGGDVHIGMYVVQFAPYSEGPEFVQTLHDEQGWEAVNAVYEAPPASTEQIIHHEKYGTDDPTEVQVEDRSSNGWHVLELDGGINYAEFGEAGLFSMFWYATYDASISAGAPKTVVVPYQDFFNYDDSGNELRDIGPYDYSHEVTAGWDGDKLLPYVDGDSAATNETGYVWKIEWDSAEDASEFLDGYVTLLEHHGATPVDGRENTYRIPDGEEFDDAYRVVRQGSTVVIVNAPTVDDLDDVRSTN